MLNRYQTKQRPTVASCAQRLDLTLLTSELIPKRRGSLVGPRALGFLVEEERHSRLGDFLGATTTDVNPPLPGVLDALGSKPLATQVHLVHSTS